jgi:hypothetical protein
MALPTWLGGILSGGFSIISEWAKGWQERKVMQAQHKVKMAEIKIIGAENRAMLDKTQEVNWDQAMSQGSMTSWKDEYWTIILSIPMVGCFIPKVAPYILEGFKVLQQTPDWYKAAVGLAIGAAFGYRKFADWNMKKYLKQGANGGSEGPAPKPEHKSFKLSRKSIMDAIKDEAKEIAKDVKDEFSTDVEIPPTDADGQ